MVDVRENKLCTLMGRLPFSVLFFPGVHKCHGVHWMNVFKLSGSYMKVAN